MSHPNLSWRAQAKPITSNPVDGSTSAVISYPSLWQASHTIAAEFGCLPDTAKKEISKALRTGVPRYGSYWKYSAPKV